MADSHQQQPFNNWPLNGSDKKHSRKWQLTHLILGTLTMYGTLIFFSYLTKKIFARVLCHLDKNLAKIQPKLFQFRTKRNNN